ncbi:hypothetical protein [Pareuzebyella sediminis]|uniref:hypothetical protein n=1 Tax=Pareuzebyella sediminis TaxID=2607998 RepID=UPI0011EDA88E|nr:hypothetical protein [Pareuzebyella sediminis]
MTAHYTSSGNFENFEIALHGKDVPQNLVQRVQNSYPNATISDVYEINGERTFGYIFEVIDNGWLFGLRFSLNGSMKIIPYDDFRFRSRIKIEND